MRPNPILAAAPVPGVYPGGTSRHRLLADYASALEHAMSARLAARKLTPRRRDYATQEEADAASLATAELVRLMDEAVGYLHRVLDSIREAKP
jgi:hypothetical protein